MACQLFRDPSFGFDFLAPQGATVEFGVRGVSAVGIISATNNGVAMAVGPTGSTASTTISSGFNLIHFLFAVSVTGDVITISEICGDGTEQTLDTLHNMGHTVTGFTINGV
jgi:hypothetical protein